MITNSTHSSESFI